MSIGAEPENRPQQQEAPARRRRPWARVRARELPVADGDLSPIWETPNKRSVPQERAVARRDTVLRRALGTSDVAAAYLALVIGVSLHLGGGQARLRATDLLIAPFIVVAAKAIGLYDRDQHLLRKTTIDEIPSIAYLSVLYALALWLAEALLFDGALNRVQIFALALASFALITAARLMARAIVTRTISAERCLLVGNATEAARVARKLTGLAGVKAAVVGRVALDNSTDGRHPSSSAPLPVGDLNSLAAAIESHRVERVIIAPDGHDQDEILNVIRLIKTLGVKVSVLPRLLEVVGSSSVFDDIEGLMLLGVRQYGMTTSSAILKRVMDLTLASGALILLGPLLAMIAVAIKLDSRGPVFFRQRRIGRSGKFFEMLKFRSMVEGADQIKQELLDRNEAEGGLFKISEDPRITWVGRFLRRTSLDELPQLFNVLGGSMSLVGPRPLVPDEDALIEGWRRRRLEVKPGMTGMWQIFGSARVPMEEMVKIDYLYGASWSLWLDLKILLRTVPYIFARRGL